MKPFLEELAEKIYNKHENDLEALTIVFPNVRAGLFFRKYLAKQLNTPIWSPAILSLEDFIAPMCPWQVLDKLTLVFRLFEVYKKQNPLEDSFERFFFWGEMLLKDFDDIDKYLINAQNLFTNLARQKELDSTFDFLSETQKETILKFWSSFEDNPSKQQQNFQQVWNILFTVYSTFKADLKADNMAYQGMVFAEVLDKMKNKAFKHPYKKVVFAGFNALTLAEEKLIAWFLEKEGAEIYWDLDNHYMEDKNQEAGFFLRQYQNKKPFDKSFVTPYPTNLKRQDATQFEVTGVPLAVGQAKVLGEQLQAILKPNSDKLELEKTVIVLPDEQMLFPVLHSIPSEIEEINVTMGFPLQSTPVYSFFEHLLDMQKRLKSDIEGNALFYHKDILAILKHPYLLHYDGKRSDNNIRLITSGNLAYVPVSDIAMDEAFYPLIFQQVTEGIGIFDYLLDILLFIGRAEDPEQSETSDTEEGVFEQEYFYHFYTQLNRLREIIRLHQVSLGFDAFIRLFRQIVQTIRLPFSGEPLRGLQVMGMLETRNLDFENVFVLSVNEGALPSGDKLHSFIPYNLRKAYGLPTYDQQDAIYAYLFYRLIQRAENVHFFYNTESGINTGGEMSRFLLQLMYGDGFDIKKKVLSNVVKMKPESPITIPKNDEVMGKLSRYLVGSDSKKRLTPSALNIYLDCRLKFYFRYVVNIYEPEQVKEEVDPMVFGNLLHHTMEFLYEEFTESEGNQQIEKEDFDRLHQLVDSIVTKAFRLQYGIEGTRKFQFEGRNIIIREIIKKFVDKILEKDKAYAPFEILGLEADENDGFILDLDIEDGRKAALKGIIDRIDGKDGLVRVIDYKTGRDEKRFENITSLFDRKDDKRNKAAMQTLYYALLYIKNRKNGYHQVVPGLFNSKEMFGNSFDIRLKIKDGDKRGKYLEINDAVPLMDEFETALKKLLSEIFSPKHPFDQTEDHKKCAYCAYKGVCHR